uniref:Uncharacterized protein n=1 Tax=Arundo donax TaxID=35708 RepID=A0A0A9C6F5_ARUDO
MIILRTGFIKRLYIFCSHILLDSYDAPATNLKNFKQVIYTEIEHAEVTIHNMYIFCDCLFAK